LSPLVCSFGTAYQSRMYLKGEAPGPSPRVTLHHLYITKAKPLTWDAMSGRRVAEKDGLHLRLPLPVVARRYACAKLHYTSPSWCSPERLFTSSMSGCLRPDLRARLMAGTQAQITACLPGSRRPGEEFSSPRGVCIPLRRPAVRPDGLHCLQLQHLCTAIHSKAE
jgi:hypothetical protein